MSSSGVTLSCFERELYDLLRLTEAGAREAAA